MAKLDGPVEEERVGLDPFAPENAPAVSLIVSMRIYDALMALLQTQDEELHDMLNKMHESGKLAWSLPWINISSDESEDFVPPT